MVESEKHNNMKLSSSLLLFLTAVYTTVGSTNADQVLYYSQLINESLAAAANNALPTDNSQYAPTVNTIFPTCKSFYAVSYLSYFIFTDFVQIIVEVQYFDGAS